MYTEEQINKMWEKDWSLYTDYGLTAMPDLGLKPNWYNYMLVQLLKEGK